MKGRIQKMPRPTKPSSLISTFLSPLALRQCQLSPRRQGRVGCAPERVTPSVTHGGEVRHAPEGGGGTFGQDPEGFTVSVSCKGEATNSVYIAFETGGIPTINWRPTGGQVSESSRAHRGKTSSESSQKPTGSSTIPILE